MKYALLDFRDEVDRFGEDQLPDEVIIKRKIEKFYKKIPLEAIISLYRCQNLSLGLKKIGTKDAAITWEAIYRSKSMYDLSGGRDNLNNSDVLENFQLVVYYNGDEEKKGWYVTPKGYQFLQFITIKFYLPHLESKWKKPRGIKTASVDNVGSFLTFRTNNSTTFDYCPVQRKIISIEQINIESYNWLSDFKSCKDLAHQTKILKRNSIRYQRMLREHLKYEKALNALNIECFETVISRVFNSRNITKKH